MTTCSGFGLFGVDYLGSEGVSLDDVRSGRSVLKKGTKGASVVAIQKLVGLVGSDADGDFGAKTEAAVKGYQSAHGLTADGVVGKGTLAELEKAGGGATQTKIDFAEAEADVVTMPVKKTTNVPVAVAADTTKNRVAVAAALAAIALAAGGIVFAFKS